MSPTDPYTAGSTAGNFSLVATGNTSPTARDTAVAQVVKPPPIREFRWIGSEAPAGGHGLLEFNWDADPGVIASVQPTISTVVSDSFFLPTLPAAGPVLFTASVRSLADSVVTATATITAVTPAPGSFQPTSALHAGRLRAGRPSWRMDGSSSPAEVMAAPGRSRRRSCTIL